MPESSNPGVARTTKNMKNTNPRTPTVEGELNIDPVTLKEFENMIHKDFVGPGPYLGYIYPTIDDEMNATTYCQPLRSPSNTSTSMSLSYRQRYPSPPKSFEDMIRKDFVSPGPYPMYILPSMLKSTLPPTANPFTTLANASMSLSYRQWYPLPPELLKDMIRKDFVCPGPYPTYVLPSMMKLTPPPTANSFAARCCTGSGILCHPNCLRT